MATRTVNSRSRTRRLRRVLLATAVACLLIAAPASALTLNPGFLSPPTAGQTATCLPGVAVPGTDVVSFEWGQWGTRVFPNSNSNAITLADTAGGTTIYCEITVKFAGVVIAQAATFPTVVKGVAPTNTSAPHITGTAKVGKTVTCRSGSWTAAPSSYFKAWLRNGSLVSLGRTRKLTNADRGHAMSCRVIAKNPYGNSTPVTSASRTVG